MLIDVGQEKLERYLRLIQNAFQASYCGLMLFSSEKIEQKLSCGHTVPDISDDLPLYQYLIDTKKISIVENLHSDPHLKSSCITDEALGFSMLVSTPIYDQHEAPIGAILILGDQSLTLKPHQNQMLRDFSALIQLELISSNNALLPYDLDDANATLDFALSHPVVGVWLANPESGKLVWDKRMKQLYDIGEDAQIESWESWLALIPEGERDRVETLFTQFQLGDDPGIIRFKINADSDAARYIECRGSKFYDQEGDWKNTIGTNRDVTEQVLMEISLKQQSKLTARALEVKSNFIACMSHEIRTPMNGVLGMIELLSFGDLSPEQREYLDIARNSGNDLIRIMNDILDFINLETDSIEFEKVDFNLSEEIKWAVEGLRPAAEQKKLQFSFKNGLSDHYEVSGDRNRIRQIFKKLIDNAIKFTESGSVEIELSLKERGDKSEWIEFSVTDTGIGIPEENLGIIFQMFSQGDSTTTRRYGGTGIGLSLVKRIVEKMSGRISVTSELEKGSRFYGRFAVDSVAHVDSRPDLEVMDREGGFEEFNVLLVEDLPLNQLVATLILEELDIEAVIAENGEKAIETLQNEDTRFDFIFMDCEMPIMDGFTATQKIREGAAGEQYKDVTIVALTAHVSEAQKLRAKEVGMDGFITKPVSFDSVCTVLDKFLVKKG